MTTVVTGPVMTAEGLSKAFGATRALSEVSLGLLPGTVHALAGANGSGKSTMIKILSGVFGADSGSVLVDGRPQTWSSPKDARGAGVGVVHQEAPLVDTLTVADCVALLDGFEGAGPLRLSQRALIRRAQRLLDEHGVPVDARTTCADLGPADRAMVSLAVATGQGSRILILDEVTAALRQDDAEQVLDLVRRLADRGTAVLMVTHRLGEIAQYADHLTVLAAGRTQYDGPAQGLTSREIVEFMLPEQRPDDTTPEHGGSVPVSSTLRRTADDTGTPLLSVRGLSGTQLAPLDFDVRPGEIVGVTGLPDSGIDELPYLLAGGLPPHSGSVQVRGFHPTRTWTASTARKQGVALLPRDRLSHGGIAVLSLSDNVALPALRRFWHRPSALRRAVRNVLRELDVRPPRPAVALGSLSGGNQQKLLLGKWLSTEPTVLILDEPTNGVDPAARLRMFEAVRKRVERGTGVVLFSSEFEQLTTHCDRMVVLRPDGPAQEIPVPDNPIQLARIVASPQEDGPK